MSNFPVMLRAPDGSTVRIDRFPIVLGRLSADSSVQPDCDLSTFDVHARVSRHHAGMEWREGRLYVTDLDSTNGTLVNGTPIPPRQLVEVGPRSIVTLGGVPISVEVEGAPPGPMPPQAAPAEVLPPAAVEPVAHDVQPEPGPPPAVAPPAPVEPSSLESATVVEAVLAEEAATDAAERPAVEPAPLPLPERPPPGDRAGTLLYALADPAALEVQVDSGRTPLVRTSDGWTPLGDGPLDAAAWTSFWSGFCEQTGTDPTSTGYVARLVGGAVTAEAFLPPIAAEPSFHARRLPPRRHLEDLLGGEDAAAVRASLLDNRGMLVLGETRQGVTAVLEGIIDAIPPGGRVSLVELRPQIRTVFPVVRLHSAQGQGAAAVELAAGTSSEWVVIDDALPEAAGLAAWRHGSGGPVPIVAGRAPDPRTWRDRAAASVAGQAGGVELGHEAMRSAFAVTITVVPGRDGTPTATLHRD